MPSSPPCMLHAHPFNSSWSDHPNTIWWGVQFTKLLIMKSSSTPCYFVPLGPKYLPQHPTRQIYNFTINQYYIISHLFRIIHKSSCHWILHNLYDPVWKYIGTFLSLLVCSMATTKFCCFLCEWLCRNRKHHYIQKQWPKWVLLIPGQKSVVSTPLMNPDNVSWPPLHIILGLIKNFIKAMDQNRTGK
jgi:hypothetical protein